VVKDELVFLVLLFYVPVVLFQEKNSHQRSLSLNKQKKQT
jgi:hypothetical protein